MQLKPLLPRFSGVYELSDLRNSLPATNINGLFNIESPLDLSAAIEKIDIPIERNIKEALETKKGIQVTDVTTFEYAGKGYAVTDETPGDKHAQALNTEMALYQKFAAELDWSGGPKAEQQAEQQAEAKLNGVYQGLIDQVSEKLTFSDTKHGFSLDRIV